MANATEKKSFTRGGRYALDNLRDPDSAVASRYGFFIYHGRSDPYSARNCNHSGAGKRHSRTEGPLNNFLSFLQKIASLMHLSCLSGTAPGGLPHYS